MSSGESVSFTLSKSLETSGQREDNLARKRCFVKEKDKGKGRVGKRLDMLDNHMCVNGGCFIKEIDKKVKKEPDIEQNLLVCQRYSNQVSKQRVLQRC